MRLGWSTRWSLFNGQLRRAQDAGQDDANSPIDNEQRIVIECRSFHFVRPRFASSRTTHYYLAVNKRVEPERVYTAQGRTVLIRPLKRNWKSAGDIFVGVSSVISANCIVINLIIRVNIFNRIHFIMWRTFSCMCVPCKTPITDVVGLLRSHYINY